MAFSISFNLSFVNCLRPRSSTDWLFGQTESAQAYGTNNGVGHEIRRSRVSFSPKAQKCSHVNGVAFNDETNKP